MFREVGLGNGQKIAITSKIPREMQDFPAFPSSKKTSFSPKNLPHAYHSSFLFPSLWSSPYHLLNSFRSIPRFFLPKKIFHKLKTTNPPTHPLTTHLRCPGNHGSSRSRQGNELGTALEVTLRLWHRGGGRALIASGKIMENWQGWRWKMSCFFWRIRG